MQPIGVTAEVELGTHVWTGTQKNQGIDFIAASFVRKASDVLAIREVLENNNATHIQIISKIEN
ncbi:MAG: hypothetical protein IIU97_03005, partial [Bacteroidaceae bacterium]|nr:hypothetical protein [Bacteroidaceae bacterium]